MSTAEYLNLLDWTTRQTRAGQRAFDTKTVFFSSNIQSYDSVEGPRIDSGSFIRRKAFQIFNVLIQEPMRV